MSASHRLRPIESYRVGDYVLSRNPESGGLTRRRVTHTFIHRTTRELYLKFSNHQILYTTPEHRFYVTGRGFIGAYQLTSRSHCVTEAGGKATVVARRYYRTKPHLVYNLEVDADHTYFVGETGIWVHNIKKSGVNAVE